MAKSEFDSKLYEDTGCAYAPKCLSCPFPACFQDQGETARVWFSRERARGIAKTIMENGWKPKQAAQALGFSVRHIYHLLEFADKRIEGDPE